MSSKSSNGASKGGFAEPTEFEQACLKYKVDFYELELETDPPQQRVGVYFCTDEDVDMDDEYYPIYNKNGKYAVIKSIYDKFGRIYPSYVPLPSSTMTIVEETPAISESYIQSEILPRLNKGKSPLVQISTIREVEEHYSNKS